MMKVRFFGVVSIVLASSGALASSGQMAGLGRGDGLVTNPFTPTCQLSYRSDSYGRGLKAGFRDPSGEQGYDDRPDWNDDLCYELGMSRGRDLALGKGTVGARECRRQFEDGLRSGIVQGSESAGSDCFVAGYSAGSADLRIGARLGDKGTVGAACVDEYQRGRGDSLAGRVANPQIEAKPGFCYQAGYFDAPLY